jgi:shikimate dehydrogenase
MVIRAGVIGHPIAHSLSPALHTRWLRAFGIDGLYEAIDCGPDAFGETIAGLRAAGFAGVNVTAPFKAEALALANRSTGTAQRLRGANTLTFTDEGIEADNTDAAGAAKALMPHLSARHGAALVLGAGGNAPAVLHALGELGVGRLTIANRTMEKACALATRFGADALPWENRDAALERADVLVNTTALGRPGSAPLTLDLERLPDHAVVMDVVYDKATTPLVAAARERGLAALDGLGMLVGQAVPGFARWFGEVPGDLAEAEAYLRSLR